MENNYYSPVQILENNIKAGISKANMGLLKMILLGMFAGMFIAIGAEGSNLAAHNLTGVGVARTLTGVVFPIGLMMLVVTGMQHARLCSRTAGVRGLLLPPGSENGCFVVGRRFALLKGDGVGGALGQAVAQAVAVILTGQLRLAVDHLNCALVARRGASSAAVALFLVNANDSSLHEFGPPWVRMNFTNTV